MDSFAASTSNCSERRWNTTPKWVFADSSALFPLPLSPQYRNDVNSQVFQVIRQPGSGSIYTTSQLCERKHFIGQPWSGPGIWPVSSAPFWKGGGTLSSRLPYGNILEALTLLLIKIIPSTYVASFHTEPSITLVSISYVPNACKTVCVVPNGR